MLTKLADADSESCGGKAATLGALLRAGLPVPDGFVVTSVSVGKGMAISPQLRSAVAGEIKRLGDPAVAVRSTAMSEDTAEASAAGQYESVLGIRGTSRVCEAIEVCWSSARAPRVSDYWNQARPDVATAAPEMAVLVQDMVPADVSGVLFTPNQRGLATRIEASWGLGPSVVGGMVTPDTYEVQADGAISFAVGSKKSRVDIAADGGDIVTSPVVASHREQRALDDNAVEMLAALGGRIAAILGGPQDIEWGIVGGVVWILQARPITAQLPPTRVRTSLPESAVLRGAPGAVGIVTGPARIVRGPSDFATVQRGDILICPYTDPAWTPLFGFASGVVTEVGGTLSHAAIVAREYGIPAVLGVPDVLHLIADGGQVTVDGAAGTVVLIGGEATGGLG